MDKFTFSYPTKVYFGEESAKEAFAAELDKIGETAMLAFGGGSIKKNGIYDEMKGLLAQAGKKVVDFPASCRIQPMQRCRKEQHWPVRTRLVLSLQWAAAA